MFNKSFNLTQYIKDIPSLSIRKAMLSSLVNSLSWSLCAAADRITERLIIAGYTVDELRELNPREVKAVLTGPETGAGKDELASLRKLWALRQEWADILARTTLVSTGRRAAAKDGRPEYGTIGATLATMTGPQRERVIDPKNVQMAQAAGFEITTADIKATIAANLSKDNFYAGLRAKRVGFTEWVIDQLFAHVTDEGDDEVFSQLDTDTKEVLANKVSAFFNKSLVTIKTNLLNGVTRDDALGLADKIIIDSLSAKLPGLLYIEKAVKPAKPAKAVDKAITIKPKKVSRKRDDTKAKPQRAPAPVQSQKVTTVLDNGIKVTQAA